MIKLSKTPILPNCEVPTVFFCINVTFKELKFCKTTQLFIVSVSLARENLGGLRELFLLRNNGFVMAVHFGNC